MSRGKKSLQYSSLMGIVVGCGSLKNGTVTVAGRTVGGGGGRRDEGESNLELESIKKGLASQLRSIKSSNKPKLGE